MSQLCPRYIPDLTRIYPRYVPDMSQQSPRYFLNMFQIIQDVSQLSLRYVPDMFQKCSSFVQDVFKICSRILDCLPIPRERLDHLDIPNPPALQPTNRPTEQPPKYRAYPDFFNHLLDWKELEIWSSAIEGKLGEAQLMYEISTHHTYTFSF